MEARSKEEYIKAWESHIAEAWRLGFVNNPELAEDVKAWLNQGKELVKRVADVKYGGE